MILPPPPLPARSDGPSLTLRLEAGSPAEFADVAWRMIDRLGFESVAAIDAAPCRCRATFQLAHSTPS